MAETTETGTAPAWGSYGEAERRYGLSRTTCWRLLKAGEIRAAKVGRTVRLDFGSIERYLERQAADFEG